MARGSIHKNLQIQNTHQLNTANVSAEANVNRDLFLLSEVMALR